MRTVNILWIHTYTYILWVHAQFLTYASCEYMHTMNTCTLWMHAYCGHMHTANTCILRHKQYKYSQTLHAVRQCMQPESACSQTVQVGRQCMQSESSAHTAVKCTLNTCITKIMHTVNTCALWIHAHYEYMHTINTRNCHTWRLCSITCLMYSNENKMLGGSASEMLREMLSAAELARVLIAAYSAHRSTRHRHP